MMQESEFKTINIGEITRLLSVKRLESFGAELNETAKYFSFLEIKPKNS